MKERFLNENYEWLDGDFIVNIKALDGSSKSNIPGGRPSQSYVGASERIKRKRSSTLLQTERLQQTCHAFLQGLRAEIKNREANMIEVLLNTSTQQKEAVYNVLFKDDDVEVSFN
ncbi:hypothetical protein QE152_g31448 [Popillia japonica]|uniref:Uncharacterized protein n=1 Tax=Popillia japonica TaxID=7064 RepID=A0AAW1J0W3_POPJA